MSLLTKRSGLEWLRCPVRRGSLIQQEQSLPRYKSSPPEPIESVDHYSPPNSTATFWPVLHRTTVPFSLHSQTCEVDTLRHSGLIMTQLDFPGASN
jgi:hypothetical protein